MSLLLAGATGITCGSPSILDRTSGDTTPITVCAWFKLSSQVTDGRICSKRDVTFGRGTNLYTTAGGVGGVLDFRIDRGSGATPARAVSASGLYTTGDLCFVAAVWDGTTAPKIYLANGGISATLAEVSYSGGSQTAGSGTVDSDADGDWVWGARNAAGADGLDGYLARCMRFNNTLSLSQLQQIMAGALNSIDGNCINWLEMIGSGVLSGTEVDLSGNGNSGTISNAAAQPYEHPGWLLEAVDEPFSYSAVTGTTHQAAAVLSAAASMSPSGVATYAGAAALVASATVTPAAAATYAGAAALTAATALSPSAVEIYAGASILAAASSIAPLGLLTLKGQAVLSATSLLEGTGTVPETFSNPVALGGTSSKSASTTLEFTVGATGAAVGHVVVVVIATNNIDTVDTEDGIDITSVTDNQANNYVRAKTFTNGQGFVGAGATVGVYYSKIDHDLSSGDIITVTFGGSVAAKAMTVGRATFLGGALALEAYAVAADDHSNLTALVISSMAVDDYLFVYGVAHEGSNVDGYTPDGTYSALTNAGTTGGSNDSNMSVRAGLKCASAVSSETTAGSYSVTTADNASVLVALHAVTTTVSGAAVITASSSLLGAARAIWASRAALAAQSGINADAGLPVGAQAVLSAISYILALPTVEEPDTTQYTHRGRGPTQYRRRQASTPAPSGGDDGEIIFGGGTIPAEDVEDAIAEVEAVLSYRHRVRGVTSYTRRRRG